MQSYRPAMNQPSLAPTLGGPLRRFDQLLRHVAAGPEGGVATSTSLRELLFVTVLCAALYGASMGTFAAISRPEGGALQILASAGKVPLLFAMTIAVTFPSFYVFCTVNGHQLSAARLLRLQMFGVAIAAAALASLSPVLAFFTLSTESHGFMVLLNTVLFGGAGWFGLRTIWRHAELAFRAEPVAQRPGEPRTNPDARPGRPLLVAWMLTAFIVGAQSSWILRPLIGHPEDSFTVFEARESNAFDGFFDILGRMFAGV